MILRLGMSLAGIFEEIIPVKPIPGSEAHMRGFGDELWALFLLTWNRNPAQRPTAESLLASMQSIYERYPDPSSLPLT